MADLNDPDPDSEIEQMPTPPTFDDHLFDDINTEDEKKVYGEFRPFAKNIHTYLNGLPETADLQTSRRGWRRRVGEQESFGTFAAEPKHWYMFNHGGRNEMQFNVGMSTSRVRIGMGFEFTLKKGGDPTIVGLTYTAFRNLVLDSPGRFSSLVTDMGLGIEWVSTDGNAPEYVDTEDVCQFVQDLPALPNWIFVGRLLERGADADVLENAERLHRVYKGVFGGFRPIWEETQLLTARHSA